METALSGTGVFYQAMPAIGADGKRIMKLIPVQMVNGQYVQTQTSKPKAAPTSQPAAMELLHLAPKRPVGPAAVKPCSSTVSSVKSPSTPVDPGLSRFLIKQHQQHAVSVLSKVPPKTTFVTTCGEAVQRPTQLPVAVNSPALPKGQYLQIFPPNTQMWTVPASQLPQGIKTQIVTSQGTPSSTPGALNVVFVSPVTTISPGVSPPVESSAGSVRPLPTTWRQTSGAKPHLKLIPKVSHRPNSPTRWVVEELGDSAVVNGKPSHSSNFFQTDHQGGAVFKEACLQSSKNNGAEGPALPKRWVIEEEHIAAAASQSVISDILQALSERERVNAQQEAVKEVASAPSQGQNNTLLMCNGKVFIVAKTNNLSFQATSPMNGSEVNPTLAICSPPTSVDGAVAKRRTERRTLGEVDEVIDLCDEEEPIHHTGSATPPDEDNVIFVSYSPPKCQYSSTSHDVSLGVQGKVKERADSSGSDRRGQPERTWPASHHVGNKPDILDVDAETKSPGDQSRETKSPGNQSCRETKSPGDQSCRKTKSPGDQSCRKTKSPGDQSCREMKSPGDQSGETKNPGDQSCRETESPGDQSCRETKSPGDQSCRETKSPGDQSCRETKSPGEQSCRETKSPGEQSCRETKSPGDQSRQSKSSGDQSRETKSPGDQNRETKSPGDQSRETKSPGDQSCRETKSPGDQSCRETKSPGDQSCRETKSPGEQSSRETKSPGEQSSRETKSPGEQSSRETKSPGEQSSRETKSPGDQSCRETKSPGDQSCRETKSPGDQSRETENTMNISASCAHIWTAESSPLMNAQLRQIHGVTADIRVILQRIDEAAPPPHDEEREPGSALEDLRPQQADDLLVSPSQTPACLSPQTSRRRKPPCDRRSVLAFIEPRDEDRSGDAAILPNARRLGRTRKRTMCQCCSPEAKSSTWVGHALMEPPGKKGSGAKTAAGDLQPCRRHSGPATRSKLPCGNSKDLKRRVRIKTVRSLLRETLMTSGVS